jgi:L-alanine-DL-glutamate epimerase-like enolase superfamily enzyme
MTRLCRDGSRTRKGAIVDRHCRTTTAADVGSLRCPWLNPLLTSPPKIAQGRLVPPPDSGLGLEVDAEAVAKYRATW